MEEVILESNSGLPRLKRPPTGTNSEEWVSALLRLRTIEGTLDKNKPSGSGPGNSGGSPFAL